MNMINHGNFNLAAPHQELLLRASLLSGKESINAFREWQDSDDWEQCLEPGSFRLLPLLYINMQKQGVDDPVMGKLKGIYRQAWSKNQTLFHEMAGVIAHLQNAGIKTMLLKGASLSLLYYKNNGARPMADIDVLIPLKQIRPATDLLQKAGWTSPLPLTDLDVSYGHAIGLMNSRGKEFDLHWRPFNGCRDEYEKDFWDSALPVKLANVNSLAPNPTDMLFHVIIHGVVWNPVPPIRWIADAVTLINSADYTIDWQRLVNLARKHHLGLRLKTGLQYLHDRFHPSIPPAVMKTVINLPVPYLEKVEYRFMTNSRENESNSPYAAFCCHLCRFRRLNAGRGIVSALTFSKSLQWRLNARNGGDLLFKGIRITADMFLSRPFYVRQR
jgi:hypothetical protein